MSIISLTGTSHSAALGAAIAEPLARTTSVHRDRFDPAYSATSRSTGAPGAAEYLHEPALKVVVVEKEGELRDHVAAWQDLADHAMESNAFYEPWMLMPAVKTLAQGKSLRFVFIYETN